jgi:phenylpyruvate tautomerase PptA (4-oxalocrotonate tautomerase family)
MSGAPGFKAEKVKSVKELMATVAGLKDSTTTIHLQR